MRRLVYYLRENSPMCRSLFKMAHRISFMLLDREERHALVFYRQFVRPGDLVYDVGANMGTKAKVFLSLGARVVAFEPQAECADFLRSAVLPRKRFELVQAAVGACEGEAEMLIADNNVLSTMSATWVSAVARSGRFAGAHWERSQHVAVTTLDMSIVRTGIPIFIKIDVEGCEYEVLRGLTHRIPFISIEYASESISSTLQCIDHMEGVAPVSYQFTVGDAATFALPSWVSASEMKERLREICAGNTRAWGDLYIHDADALRGATATDSQAVT